VHVADERAMNLSSATASPAAAPPRSVVDPAHSPAPAPTDDQALPPRAAPDASGDDWALWNERTALRPIVDAIDGAKRYVDVEFFAFSDAGKGAHLVDALERAAQRGVEVNVMADSTSVFALPVGSFQRLHSRIEDAGGTVHTNIRMPVVKNRKDEPALQHVDHRKVVVVDGTTAFTGGINYIKLEDDFHDSMVQLSGTAAARLAADQLDRWTRVNGASSDAHRKAVTDALGGASLVPTDPNEMRIVSNAPDQGRFDLTDAYRDLIRSAKHRLWISSPGYSDQELVEELRGAAERGVDVRLVAPGVAPLGIPVIRWLNRSHLRNLVDRGANAYEIPEMLHRKALIADDEVVFSSFNVTNRSSERDHEIGLRTKDPAFVDAVAAVVQRDIDRAGSVHADAQGVGDRIGDWLGQKVKVNY
jgi:cardiolipin synthase